MRRRDTRADNGDPTRIAVCFFLCIATGSLFAGCGGNKSVVPVGDAAENIRKLSLTYVQYAGANRGVGPANKEILAKYVAQDNLISVAEAEALLVSPRDKQPYVIRWAQRPMGSPVGNKPPEPNIIIFENTGADGTRYVADGRTSVKELSEEAFSQAVPDHQSSKE
ncbi:MAG: hypothetical protein WD851_22020 [Pirellulales bacterium]